MNVLANPIRPLVTQMVKNLPEMWDAWVQSLGREDCPEKDMPTHSSIRAWRLCGQRSLVGYIQFMGLQTVRHYWVTTFLLSILSLSQH